MPIGEGGALRSVSAARSRERGFSYLLLLFSLALGGVALAGLGEQWHVQTQREREADLLHRGLEIRAAIESYGARIVLGRREMPARLGDLVEDRRDGAPVHHLRRVYLDPFTGKADWIELRDEQDRLVGVHSRATVIAYARHNLPVPLRSRPDRPEDAPASVGDWLFVATPIGPAADPAAKPPVAQ